nr:hypothetical protein [Tanacetum cinerariifolium]
MAFISFSKNSNNEDGTLKEFKSIDGIGWDWSYMENEEDHALVANRETPSEFSFMANIENKVETLKEEKDVVDGKLACLLKSLKDLENIIESQRSEKVKERVGYNAIPPPAADLYLSPKKDLSWTGLPEFVDDTKNGKRTQEPGIIKKSQPKSTLVNLG